MPRVCSVDIISSISASQRGSSGPRGRCRTCRISSRFSFFLGHSEEILDLATRFAQLLRNSTSWSLRVCRFDPGDHLLQLGNPLEKLSSSQSESNASSMMNASCVILRSARRLPSARARRRGGARNRPACRARRSHDGFGDQPAAGPTDGLWAEVFPGSRGLLVNSADRAVGHHAPGGGSPAQFPENTGETPFLVNPRNPGGRCGTSRISREDPVTDNPCQ